MKKKLIGVIIIIIIFLGVIFFDNGSDYTIKSVKYNGKNLKISIDGSTSSTLPTSGSYYLASYDCESDETKLSWNSESYELIVSNGNKRSGISCYLDFQTNPLLYYMEEGSYVKYRKTDNCSDDDASCRWYNANYVSDTNMGYCNAGYGAHKFIVNGWRIAYKENGSAYLISAGAPECVCTNSDESISNSCSSFEQTSGVPKHLANLDTSALNYCREEYIKDGVCDNTTVWAMDATDFEKITGSQLYYNSSSDKSCYGSNSDMNCGYSSDLIDVGSDYWIASPASSHYMFNWEQDYRLVEYISSEVAHGVRPVLYLDPNVVVTGGSGTYEDPYTISNNTFTIDEASLVSEGNNRNVTLNLIALDSVTQVCVNVDSSSCSNYVDFPESNTYSLDLSSYGTGEKTIYVYYKNANGKIVASMHKIITLS